MSLRVPLNHLIAATYSSSASMDSGSPNSSLIDVDFLPSFPLSLCLAYLCAWLSELIL